MTWTDKQLADAEQAVINLVDAIGLTEQEAVNVIADGLAMKYKGNLPEVIYDLIDELRSIFNAY